MTTSIVVALLPPGYLLHHGEQTTFAVASENHSHSVDEIFELCGGEFGLFQQIHLRVEVVRYKFTFQFVKEVGEKEFSHVVAVFFPQLTHVVVPHLKYTIEK